MKENKISIRQWFIFILIGIAGQFAWCVENMYLNTYITYLNFTDTAGGGFNYSFLIALTTALSAIAATLTTLFMGGLIDKVGKRKQLISIGYIVWGLSTASFGLFNVTSSSSLIVLSMTASMAAIMVIVVDCIMTFFGSTANDAAFNSYVTRNTSDNNRGKVEGVLSILPLVAMLIMFVALNFLTTKDFNYRWDLFFYIIGGLVIIVGIISLFLIPKEEKEDKPDEKYFSLILEGFKPKTIKENKLLYLVLLTYFVYGVATQAYFPYLMVYIQYTCNIANSGSGFLTPFAIVMAVSLLFGSLGSVIIGNLADKYGKNKLIIPTIVILFVGLIFMLCIPYVKNDLARTIYGAFSGFVMILGYVAVPTIINSLVRQYIPRGKEGTFMGVRMIFVVALPMCIGPFIGDALNNNFGSTYLSEFNVESVIPTNYCYIAGAVLLLLSIIPVYFILKENRKQNDSHK